ncbi:MAG: hypothetical protein SOZ54_02650, partial [Candidatus Limiplasma sp.]|nr:hypothetical protein [Candidatus Limiplasma sp.]
SRCLALKNALRKNKQKEPDFSNAEKSGSDCQKSGGAGGVASCRGFRGRAPKIAPQYFFRKPAKRCLRALAANQGFSTG